MHHHCPDPNPTHEGEVVDALGHDNVIDSVVEHRDGTWTGQRDSTGRNWKGANTSHADDDQRLPSGQSEHHRSKNGSEEHFVDTVAHVGLCEHIQRKSKSWKNTARMVSWQASTITPC
jgi:ribulose 1,5-bisphosphate synthetase/thiazole synthase